MAFYLQVMFRDEPERWVTLGVHSSRAGAAHQGGGALAASVAPSGADALGVRIVTERQLRRERQRLAADAPLERSP
jgi:hypothetical protein